ncbi:MAG TPA: AbrB/MazE/SpoVT family DNA-binding domain-containing protein [Bacteroidetes bacterium]|nr:AbrB/MazE/SpoVT family DNA-binding domain-containing protein [Bacteroidota bacterium]
MEKIEKQQIRKLTKVAGGSSYAVVIPREFIEKLGWKARQKLDIKLYGDRIIIRDWEPGTK